MKAKAFTDDGEWGNPPTQSSIEEFLTNVHEELQNIVNTIKQIDAIKPKK